MLFAVFKNSSYLFAFVKKTKMQISLIVMLVSNYKFSTSSLKPTSLAAQPCLYLTWFQSEIPRTGFVTSRLVDKTFIMNFDSEKHISCVFDDIL